MVFPSGLRVILAGFTIVTLQLGARDSNQTVGLRACRKAVDDIQKVVVDKPARNRVAHIAGKVSGRLGHRPFENWVAIDAAEFTIYRLRPSLPVIR